MRLYIFYWFCVISSSSYAQLTSGKIAVCQNDVAEYGYNGGSANCQVEWMVTGGVFPDHGNVNRIQLFTGSDFISMVKIKWNAVDYGEVSVASNCSGGNDTESITIFSIQLAVSVSSTSINLGEQVTLTGSSPYTPSYSWSPLSGNLSSSIGSTVTAVPNETTTFQCTATQDFQFNFGPKFTCTQKSSVTVSVTVPEITGNYVCCNQCSTPQSAVSMFSQSQGTVLGGGNGKPFIFQWQKSNDGTIFSNVVNGTSASYNPGVLNQNTWFRRVVSGVGATSLSNVVFVQVVPSTLSFSASSYNQDVTHKALGMITIQGNQSTTNGAQVYFMS